MTDKQLFEAFGGVKEKYLSEMLDDEPQRALELRPVKSSPLKKIVLSVTACAAAVGITVGALTLGGKLDILALSRGSFAQLNEPISSNASISLENIVLNNDWLDNYPENEPSDFFKEVISNYDYNSTNQLRSDLANYVERDTSYSFTPVTAVLKLSFSAWNMTDEDKIVAQVQFFADGERINYLPLKDPYYYHPETKYKHEGFDPIMLVYGDMGHLTLDKSLADNASSDSDEKFFEFPVTFDVKDGVSQITVMVEFVPYNYAYTPENVYPSTRWEVRYDEIFTETFPIGSMIENYEEYKNSDPMNSVLFNTKNQGWFETEQSRADNSEKHDTNRDMQMIVLENGTLKLNIGDFNTNKTPYYLMVLQNGEPVECFDGKISRLIDPSEPISGRIDIPKECLIPDGRKRELRMIAIPIVDDLKYSGGVYTHTASDRLMLWVNEDGSQA